MNLSARALRIGAALLCVTGCGGTNATPSAMSEASSSDAWARDVADATLDEGPALDDAGVDATDLDAGGLEVAAPAWALLDSACSPPPFDDGAESGPPLGDAGLRTITTLPDGGTIGSIAVDDAAAYWTDYAMGSVMRAPLAGGPPELVADVGTPSPAEIAVDDTYVYWVSVGGQRILRCPKGASNCTPFVVLAPLKVRRIALDSNNVYTLSGDRVLACPKTGCRNTPTVIGSGLGTPYDIVVQGGNLYMLAYPPPPANGGVQVAADVLRCPVSGCGSTPTALASGADPTGLAVDGRYAYWVSQIQADQPVSIMRCAVCGCAGTPDVILPTSAGVHTYSVVTDGVRLFFSDGALTMTPRLLACPVDGCPSGPTQLLAGIPSLLGLTAVGGDGLIFLTGSQILTLPK